MNPNVITLIGLAGVAFFMLRNQGGSSILRTPVVGSGATPVNSTANTTNSLLSQLLRTLNTSPAQQQQPKPSSGSGSGVSLGSGSGSGSGSTGSGARPPSPQNDPFSGAGWPTPQINVASSAGDYVDGNGNLRDASGNLVGIDPVGDVFMGEIPNPVDAFGYDSYMSSGLWDLVQGLNVTPPDAFPSGFGAQDDGGGGWPVPIDSGGDAFGGGGGASGDMWGGGFDTVGYF